MSVPPSSEVLLIGSDPSQARPGGVITHMRFLKGLPCFDGAALFDVGSLHGTAALSGRFALLRILRNVLALRRLCVRKAFTTILINQPIATPALVKLFLVLIAIPQPHQKRVWAFYHGGRFENIGLFRFKAFRTLCRPLMKRANAHFFLSSVEKKGFTDLFPALPAYRFSNYSEFDSPLEPLERGTRTFELLFVGRIAAVKGVFDLVDAVGLLTHRMDREIHCTFVGSGPDAEKLEAYVQARGLSDRITLFPFLSGTDLERRYQSADAFVLPTRHPEGFPYVVIEAMRAGLPIVSTPEGVLQDLISDGVNGFLIRPDSPEEIADAVRKMVDDPLRNRISESNSALFVAQLTRSCGLRYYQRLLDGGPSSVETLFGVGDTEESCRR